MREHWQDDAVNVIAVNRLERDIKALAGEAHDIGFDDIPELLQKLDGIVGACSEWHTLARRIEDAQAERMSEPYDSGWVADWNRAR